MGFKVKRNVLNGEMIKGSGDFRAGKLCCSQRYGQIFCLLDAWHFLPFDFDKRA